MSESSRNALLAVWCVEMRTSRLSVLLLFPKPGDCENNLAEGWARSEERRAAGSL